ncbi:MAG: hypothetical protein HUJ51_05115 [Eggerthellaceae bacterium]|nr:hypothetical protein [Eggerthellaceae bacterium]
MYDLESYRVNTDINDVAIGWFANRIKDELFTLISIQYQLAKNENNFNNNHGSYYGFKTKFLDVMKKTGYKIAFHYMSQKARTTDITTRDSMLRSSSTVA